jgi:hypothetical protein
MYIPALPKESASVRKDESINSSSTLYARYKSSNSATGGDRNSILAKFRYEEVKQIFEQRSLLFNFDALLDQKNEQLNGLDLSIVKLINPIPNYPKKIFTTWVNYLSKSSEAPSKAGNLDKTTTDKQPIQIMYDGLVATQPNDRQPIETVQNRLIELLQEEEECDISKPTPHSFTTAWRLVNEASKLRGKYFQKATVATDDEGGIRLRWRNPNKDREVRLYCPANPTKKMYIYHEEDDSYGAEYNVSGRTLANWLYWLSDA